MVMKKLEMNWAKILILAVVTGVYTGVVAMVPALKETSLQDISISFEWWILFGILIILGSKSNRDAALKCFVFFLISQPLVYLTQVVFGSAGWEIFGYYRRWFVWTILTLPVGYMGYYLKKDKWWGLLIMTPIWLLLGAHVNMFMGETIGFFPNHLLSLIFCLVTMYLYVFWIFGHKRERWIGVVICTVIVAACVVLNLGTRRTYNTTILCSSEELSFDDSYSVKMDEKFGTVKIVLEDFGTGQSYCVNAEFKKLGNTTLMLEGAEGKYEFDLTVERDTYDLEMK